MHENPRVLAHDRDVNLDRAEQDAVGRPFVAERPVLRRCIPVGWPVGPAKVAAWLTIPRTQGILSEVLDHIAGVFDVWACLVELPPDVVRDLRRHRQRFHNVGRHTLRPQQQSQGKQEQTGVGLVVWAASTHPVCA